MRTNFEYFSNPIIHFGSPATVKPQTAPTMPETPQENS